MEHYSQHNEDEIIADICSKLGLENGQFVEFGAWDGKHLSNTYALYRRGWRGYYIEGEPSRVADLEKNCPEDRIVKVCSFVQPEGDSSLDAILGRHGATEIDLLSIDIDSDDYRVWEGVKRYLPKVLVIEYNQMIPFDTRYINPPGAQHGNSALSLTELSAGKGYTLVAGTMTNLIFVRDDLAVAHGIASVGLQDLQDALGLSRYFFAYDGTLVRTPSSLLDRGVDAFFMVPWANCPVPQPLPRWLRKFRDPGTPFFIMRQGYGALRSFLRSPVQTLKALSFARAARRSKRAPASVAEEGGASLRM